MGGRSGIHVDYYENHAYCPVCKTFHTITHCREGINIKGNTFPLLYCPVRHACFIKAKNGYFDLDGQKL